MTASSAFSPYQQPKPPNENSPLFRGRENGKQVSFSSPISLAALGLAAVAILANLVAPHEATRNFPFNLVIVLWSEVLLSLVLREFGLSADFAEVVAVMSAGSPAAALAVIFLLS